MVRFHWFRNISVFVNQKLTVLWLRMKIALQDDNSPEAIGPVVVAAKWKDDYKEFVVAIGNLAW